MITSFRTSRTARDVVDKDLANPDVKAIAGPAEANN